MELQDYLRIWRRNWILILATTLVVTALAAVWSLTRVPEYQAKSQLYVSVRTGETSVGDMTQGTNFARQAVTSYVDVVSTSIVMDQVAADLGGDLTSQELAKRVSASSPTNTVLIDITATDADPVEAAEIANVTSSVFADVVSNQLEKPSDGSPARVQIDVVQPAQVPDSPVSPNVKRNLALGLLLGLMLGLGGAVLRSVLDTKIRTRQDVAAITADPVLGRISFDPDAATRPLIVHDSPTSPRAEAFRSLRTNLQFLKVEGNPRSFVITSSGPAEGKSTTAANLAIAIAQAGSTVCIVDGDLRKPRVAELLGVEGGVGVTDVLIGRSELSTALQAWGHQNLFVLPAGHRPPNPSELLGSSEMAQLLESLQSRFDYVIVDAPPVLLVTDAAVVSKHVGGALMVAAAGRTRKEGLNDALGVMENIDARVLGIILTMVPEKGPDSYSYGAYTYGDAHSAATYRSSQPSSGEVGSLASAMKSTGSAVPSRVVDAGSGERRQARDGSAVAGAAAPKRSHWKSPTSPTESRSS